jgi:dihydrofolate synthase/folylpolyglutamate synthase
MNTYERQLKFLYDLEYFGIKLGLHNISALLRYLDSPHTRYPTIHIAGTNGKGSTAALIASALTAAGYRTGLYTSPHLIRFNERIRVNGKEIGDEDIVHYMRALRPQLDLTGATFFEATTAMAFKYFFDQRVNVAVIETGLGGRLDSTNVITPEVSVITSIGYDHKEHLGNTLERIAFEKAGIIKPGVSCVTGAIAPGPLAVIKQIAKRKQASVYDASKVVVTVKNSSLEGLKLDVNTRGKKYSGLHVSLAGEHQIENAKMALAALEIFADRTGKEISREAVRKGFSNVHRYSGFRARLESVSKTPLIIADVAHNPPAMRTLVRSLEKLHFGRWVTVFGVMSDKEFGPILSELAKVSRLLVSGTPATNRALPGTQVTAAARAKGIESVFGGAMPGALKLAIAERRCDEAILVTGSHFVVGEILAEI